jgi:hypothetical protein
MVPVVYVPRWWGGANAVFLWIHSLYCAVLIVRVRCPLSTSSLVVYTDAVLAFNSCWTMCRVSKEGSVVVLPNEVRTGTGKCCVTRSFVDAIFVGVNLSSSSYIDEHSKSILKGELID